VPSLGFNSAPSNQQQLLFSLQAPLDNLEAMLLGRFAGLSLTMEEVFHQHNIGHRYTLKNYKLALLRMEARSMIETDPPSNNRKPGTFGNRVKITFPRQ
jgi:hypothetical protein